MHFEPVLSRQGNVVHNKSAPCTINTVNHTNIFKVSNVEFKDVEVDEKKNVDDDDRTKT